ncbi:Phosphoglycerate mutase [Stanieria cyanosphaera PCC 7437]|uniref:Phosphoglycerate mutase n=1 Tax=Stanieria cyanosphaera (strain ATCC 29371 / PCC 7437) TaxID=111780 RepID=K9XWK9_STAC7|nr:histidine phosphatase family protein [Stanieria cyanosphaera]AFZ36459.1 Phosphoglycerate mutase [Stanieria cyanosphaera PCC 7437]
MRQTVWIARHGNRFDFVNPQWFNNAIRRYDPPLSEDGFIQARQLGNRLQGEQITQIFSSPFLRTIQTANEVAEILDLPIKLEAGLSEWHKQDWMSESPQIHPREYLKIHYPRIDWTYHSQIFPQYPESEIEVNTRTMAIAQKLVSKYTENILLVGHSASVLGATRGLVVGDPVVKTSLCCLVKVIRQHDRWHLELNGDTSHLNVTEQKVRLN